VEVKPSYGLTDGEIESMLRDSIAHAGEDVVLRRLREQQVEARRAIEALQAALASDGDLFLAPEERGPIDHAIAVLRQASSGDDPEAIRRAIEDLEKACERYVERRMNASIRKAMAGHKVEEFE
jgi:molecular chaperone HscA